MRFAALDVTAISVFILTPGKTLAKIRLSLCQITANLASNVIRIGFLSNMGLGTAWIVASPTCRG
jgi:hypothetical protein